MNDKVLIMGAGHQGLAMAAHMSMNGVECYLWNRSYSNIKEIVETGFIECFGVVQGKIKVKKVSSSLEGMIQKTIMVTTPSSAHRDIAKILAQYVDESFNIILNPGRTFGIIDFICALKKYGCMSIPKIAETQTIIYTCRRNSFNSVWIYALKEDVKIAAYKKEQMKSIMGNIPICIRGNFKMVDSYIETSLSNVGMILHCAPVLMNVGWIENKKVAFEYYYDGISPTVANVIEKIDDERMLVAKEMGVKVESVSEWLIRTYHTFGDNLYEQLQNNKYYRGIDAPVNIHHRYLEEDVPNGLVALESAANYLGIETPVTTSVINFANLVMNTDYRKIGRNYNEIMSKL